MCRKVQVERPRASTSGGQSGGRRGVEGVVEERGVVGVVVAAEEVSFLVMASQEETEVQERQLLRVSLRRVKLVGSERWRKETADVRFAIFAQHDALG